MPSAECQVPSAEGQYAICNSGRVIQRPPGSPLIDINRHDVRPQAPRRGDEQDHGYYSSNADASKKRRKIEIRVKQKPKLQLTYKTSYTLKPPAKH
jgi:hypothetical protein